VAKLLCGEILFFFFIRDKEAFFLLFSFSCDAFCLLWPEKTDIIETKIIGEREWEPWD